MFFWRNRKPLPPKEEEQERIPLEKGDLGAMVIAALLVYVPALLLIIGLIVGILWFFFNR